MCVKAILSNILVASLFVAQNVTLFSDMRILGAGSLPVTPISVSSVSDVDRGPKYRNIFIKTVPILLLLTNGAWTVPS